MDSAARIFDAALHRRHQARAADRFADHDFLFRRVAADMLDRVSDVNRRFERPLIIGGRGLLALDGAVRMELTAPPVGICGDPEWLPFGPDTFDLILAPLALHWCNDLPGTLIQLRRALRPDGLLLVALFGAGTLRELRQALMEAELEQDGGVSPRISPFIEIRDAGGLLQRAGFALPVADQDTVTVAYQNPLRLLADLRGMGEQNALIERRRHFLKRGTLMRAMAIYQERFAGADGRVPASFDFVWLTGWSPDASQPQPLRPGTARHRLADALNATEIGTGETAGDG